MPYATLAICDLDAAVKAKVEDPYGRSHTQVCLLAQFAKRITGKEVEGSTSSAAQFVDEDGYNFHVRDIGHLVMFFDQAVAYPENIAEIRRALPFDVEYSYDVPVES